MEFSMYSAILDSFLSRNVFFSQKLRTLCVYLNAIPTGKPYRAVLSRAGNFCSAGVRRTSVRRRFLKQEMHSSCIGIAITAPTMRAERRKKHAARCTSSERCHVSNHLRPCLFQVFFFLPFFRPPFRRSLPLSGSASFAYQAAERVGSLNYLIQRHARAHTQNENAPELMDRCKDTHNSRTNLDSMIEFTIDGYFPAIFMSIVVQKHLFILALKITFLTKVMFIKFAAFLIRRQEIVTLFYDQENFSALQIIHFSFTYTQESFTYT